MGPLAEISSQVDCMGSLAVSINTSVARQAVNLETATRDVITHHPVGGTTKQSGSCVITLLFGALLSELCTGYCGCSHVREHCAITQTTTGQCSRPTKRILI